MNLDKYADVSTHWIALLCNRNGIVYLDKFGIEHVLEEIKEFIGNKNIKANIFRVQANDSGISGYLCRLSLHRVYWFYVSWYKIDWLY